MKLKVTKRFNDVKTLDKNNKPILREVGQVFEAEQERAEELLQNPHGIVEVYTKVEVPKEDTTPPLKSEKEIEGEKDVKVEPKAKEAEKDDVDEMSYQELKKEAKKLGIKGNLKKDVLIEKIREERAK